MHLILYYVNYFEFKIHFQHLVYIYENRDIKIECKAMQNYGIHTVHSANRIIYDMHIKIDNV